jgi:hypothetical protein
MGRHQVALRADSYELLAYPLDGAVPQDINCLFWGVRVSEGVCLWASAFFFSYYFCPE